MPVWKSVPRHREIVRPRPATRALTGIRGYSGVMTFSDSNFSVLVVNVFTR